MNPFEIYDDLINEIEILRDQIQLLESERVQWYMGGRLFNTVPMENAIIRVDRLSDKIEALYGELDIKREREKHLKQQLSKFNSLENKIAFMRRVEKKSLVMIADELGYSYDYIKEVSSRMRKRMITA